MMPMIRFAVIALALVAAVSAQANDHAVKAEAAVTATPTTDATPTAPVAEEMKK
jgi:hypothetical protein